MISKITTTTVALFIFLISFAQQPRYTFKHFVAVNDTTVFKVINPASNGFIRTYITEVPQIWDIDDDSTTFIMGGQTALLCLEGQLKNHKKEGMVNVYLIDSTDHSKRYRIWEQQYVNGKLNGLWNTYTLHGTLVSTQTFTNDSLNGIARDFWIDGKTIMDEREYVNGRNQFSQRSYYPNGKLKSAIPYLANKISGVGKKYYEDGTLQEVAEFTNGDFNGVRKYYYANGQLWIEQVYKDGKSWTVVANYTDKGQKRDAGTLHDGNGTVIFYNEDGAVRETITYVNGEQKQ